MAISIEEIQTPPEDSKTYVITVNNHSAGATVTDSPEVVDWWIDVHFDNSRKAIFGLDVEWLPNFDNNGRRNPVATLQLCDGRCCLVYQILRSSGIPESLYDVLKNNKFQYVGKGIADDAEKLLEDYDLKVTRTVDVGDLAAQLFDDKRFHNMGLKGLVGELLGEEIEKPKWVTLSKWDAKKLSPAQVKYACVDAFYSYELGKYLLEN